MVRLQKLGLHFNLWRSLCSSGHQLFLPSPHQPVLVPVLSLSHPWLFVPVPIATPQATDSSLLDQQVLVFPTGLAVRASISPQPGPVSLTSQFCFPPPSSLSNLSLSPSPLAPSLSLLSWAPHPICLPSPTPCLSLFTQPVPVSPFPPAPCPICVSLPHCPASQLVPIPRLSALPRQFLSLPFPFGSQFRKTPVVSLLLDLRTSFCPLYIWIKWLFLQHCLVPSKGVTESTEEIDSLLLLLVPNPNPTQPRAVITEEVWLHSCITELEGACSVTLWGSCVHSLVTHRSYERLDNAQWGWNLRF
ncbi:uncharacterized protein [Lepidochelys kempii]|uniref:uncharacterized protein n=1 Tax=Lepidochelys kempii TaxID=8472 RepID=UPI003C6F21E7